MPLADAEFLAALICPLSADNNPPTTLAGQKVVRILDFKIGQEKDVLKGATKKLDLPSSDVLQFYTADGSKISVRPSGTEPKIKFYISVSAKLQKPEDFKTINGQLDSRLKEIEKEIIQ